MIDSLKQTLKKLRKAIKNDYIISLDAANPLVFKYNPYELLQSGDLDTFYSPGAFFVSDENASNIVNLPSTLQQLDLKGFRILNMSFVDINTTWGVQIIQGLHDNSNSVSYRTFERETDIKWSSWQKIITSSVQDGE